MEAVKLKNSCICGNTRPYTECCGFFATAPAGAGEGADTAAFRHDLHELYMYLFPLRNLYQAYWERLSQEGYPHHLLMADPDYGRAVMANFFWDYSVQFSDARPVLRAARDVEEKDLRLSNDFRQWSLAPLWPWYVVESDERHAHLRMADSDRTRRVEHGGEPPEPGTFIFARVLPYRGREHLHPAVLRLPRAAGRENFLNERLRAVRQNLGVKSGSGLRPDVQCEEWRRHGAMMLGLWRELVYDAHVGIPSRTVGPAQFFHLPVSGTEETLRQLRAGGAFPLEKGRFELRHRALSLARLEVEGADLRVTLLDEVYRPYAFRWLADHLGAASRPAPENAPEEGTAPASAGDWKAWMQVPQESLNGQSPMEASLHDFGRRKLEDLLQGMSLPPRDRTALNRQLGL